MAKSTGTNRRMVEDCYVEIQAERGVIYVHTRGYPLIRISGLTKEQCTCEQIDVRALQPRSHNETLYGWAEDGPVPESLLALFNHD
jgi:hypothetical protein